MSVTPAWYAERISRRSSGSSRAESAVEPTRSQNMIVSCRRSASSSKELGARGAAGELQSPTTPKLLPQDSQNRAPGEQAAPQELQVRARRVPQELQNRAVARFSNWHLVHRTAAAAPAMASAPELSLAK